jgi:hypothetical protein
MTITVMLDWRDAYTGGVSLLLLLSFWLAFHARNIAKTDDHTSQWYMLWSGLLLLTGHGILLVVTAILSIEGLWPANVGFMLFGARAVIGMALGLRRLRKEAPATPADPEQPAAVQPPPQVAPPPPMPSRPAAPPNGQLLPVQREPNGNRPRPLPTPTLGDVPAALAQLTATDTIAPPGRPKASQ